MSHRASGRVSRLYVDEGHCYIKLEGAQEPPLDGYFELRKEHPNHNALYSLVLAAAVNRYTITIRTVGEIDPMKYAPVAYATVDW
jgi:hypothetical protein